ncbi:SRPBCC family protein [Streptoalloteichus hindustanus]|uniref:Ligand-binding SRPBCC domain-containing protein n=1 Tax=Streptoalloteichus hindustanus TaxID=2017 RepID=A0A1M5GND8_STRHI|nr:SRPBCC family protein [Streptoalloteichus hindustanus]SHG05245.1 Ligand-binding SRPBCC domain-containing protein [Streptoalloteichus hindustanus]
MTARFELTTRVPAPVEAVFDASLDVDVHLGSMRRSGERVVGGVRSGRMGLADTVTWQARHFGVPWRMTSVISACDRPHRFVDEQVRGPFRRWWHEHVFEVDPDDPTRTTMRDAVEFAAPAGPLGRLVAAAGLRRYLERLIVARNAHIVEVLAGARPQ